MILLVRIVGLMFVLRVVVLGILRVILELLIIRIGCVSRVRIVRFEPRFRTELPHH